MAANGQRSDFLPKWFMRACRSTRCGCTSTLTCNALCLQYVVSATRTLDVPVWIDHRDWQGQDYPYALPFLHEHRNTGKG